MGPQKQRGGVQEVPGGHLQNLGVFSEISAAWFNQLDGKNMYRFRMDSHRDSANEW